MKSRKNELDIRHRRNIYNFILKHPGHHYREICKALGISKNNISYHLNYLLKRGLITENVEEGYSRYYIVHLEGEKAEKIAKILGESITYDYKNKILEYIKVFNPGGREKEVINLLRRPVLLKIVRLLYSHPESTQIEICKVLNIHQTTVSSYLKKLIKKDIVEKKSEGEIYRYQLKDEELVYHVLRLYFVFREELNKNGDPSGISKNNYMNDVLLDHVFDLFCLPFCAGYKPWSPSNKD